MKQFRHALKPGLMLAALVAVAAANAQDGTNYVELKKIAEREAAKSFAAKTNADMVAMRLGMPIRYRDPKTKVLMEVMSLSPQGAPVYYMTRNKNAAITTRANRVHPGGGAGLNLNGSGIVMGVWDGGSVRGTHVEFTSRVTVVDAVATDWHATHVAGTMIAAGVNDLIIGGNTVTQAAKGMSFAGTLRSRDWNSDSSEVATDAALATPIRISNHSYGPGTGWTWVGFWRWYGWTPDSTTEDSSFGRYSNACATFDDIAVNAPFYLGVWAAGNDRLEGPPLNTQPIGQYWDGAGWASNTTVRDLDGGTTGYDTISGVGMAKNVLCVGAVNDVLNYTGPGSVPMSSFSCWGPMDDGRIKPDVVGNGVGLASASDGTDSAYALSDGTSMASPNVAGSLGLLQQHYRATHGGGDMRSSMLRGLVIHTADECGPSPGPDYMYGWGLMDTEAAAKVISDDQTNPNVMRDDSIAQGENDKFWVTSDGTTPLKVTICWTDPAGTPINSGLDPIQPMLKHDLDLQVKHSSGTTYSPYMLIRNSPSNPAITGDNNVDNVEVVEIAAPAAGLYEIIVDHDGTITGAQNYSLIVTGPRVSPIMTNFSVLGTWITGRNSTNGVVTIDSAAPAGGVDFYARLSVPNSFQINQPVNVAAGQTTKNFVIKGNGDVTVNTPYSIWMHSGYNFVGRAGTLVPLRINSMTLAPNPVQAGNNLTLTVGLNGPAPLGGQNILINTSHTYWVQAPTNFVIPANAFSGSVQIPIRPGAPAITGARVTIYQDIPGADPTLQKLFNIIP